MALRRVLFLSVLAPALLGLPLTAQEARGTLLGRVTDSSGALIVRAKVEAQNVDTGVKFSSLTNRTGRFSRADLAGVHGKQRAVADGGAPIDAVGAVETAMSRRDCAGAPSAGNS